MSRIDGSPRSSISSLDESSFRSLADAAPRGAESLSGSHAVSAYGTFDNDNVSVRSLHSSQGLEAQQAESRTRAEKQCPSWGKRALAGVLLTLVAVPKLAAGLLTTAAGLLVGGAAKLVEKATTACVGISDARMAREEKQNLLGADKRDDAANILNKSFQSSDWGTVVAGSAQKRAEIADIARAEQRDALAAATGGGGALVDIDLRTSPDAPGFQPTIRDRMDVYLESLGDNRVTKDEMYRYIAAGQRIVDAVVNGDGTIPVEVAIPDGGRTQAGDRTIAVKPDLDTVRSISWYLQAKALADNSASHRPGTTVGSGAMIGADPGNKLFNFLEKSDNAYGRCSTHCAERSSSVDTSWLGPLRTLWDGGVAALGAYAKGGQPLQFGIEDFDRKMPSKGGTLLFDKLQNNEIYLKWEHNGTPNSFAFAKQHADAADGFADRMLGRGMALPRNIGHAISFAGNADPGNAYRGEKMDKGEAKQLYRDFETALKGPGTGMTPERTKDALKECKTYGASEVLRTVDRVLADTRTLAEGGPTRACREELQDIRTKLTGFIDQMGADMGIDRKGNEVHLRIA